jgi:outer membrane murein-binding lipoprotein Lpp
MRNALIILSSCLLAGCVSTVGTIVTAPVKVVSKGVDWATTSQDEADRNRGREVRKQEKREREERKRAEKEWRRQQRED